MVQQSTVPFRCKHNGQQRPIQVWPKQFIALVQHFAKARLCIVEQPPHAHVLRTLTGKEKGGSSREIRFSPAKEKVEALC